MKDIEKLIREARVQRSAAIGMALGEALGSAWLAAAKMFQGEPVRRVPRTDKTVPAR